MARMHSGKKGKSGSTKPMKKTAPSWERYKETEIEMIIAKLAKEGKSASEIGLVLRDSYGIPDVRVILKKKLMQVLKEKGLSQKIPEDLQNLIKRSIQIRKHLEDNRQDMTAKRGLQLTESKVKRLVGYYKKIGVLPAAWKYDAESVRLLVE